MSIRDCLTVSDAVAEAAAPVALETTAIAHGLPYPQNFDDAGGLIICVPVPEREAQPGEA